MKPVKIRDCKRSRTFDTPMSFHWFMPFGPISSNCRATIGHVVNDENTGKVYAKGWKCRCASTVNRNSPPGKKCGLITKRRTGRLGGQTTATASEADNGKKKKVVSVLDLISRPYWPYTI